jgi:hypothetical protein
VACEQVGKVDSGHVVHHQVDVAASVRDPQQLWCPPHRTRAAVTTTAHTKWKGRRDGLYLVAHPAACHTHYRAAAGLTHDGHEQPEQVRFLLRQLHYVLLHFSLFFPFVSFLFL